MKKNRIDRIVLTGPTGAGKSGFALELCRSFPGLFEIISADSVQVYRGLDIGSGKVSAKERKAVPHHLIDILDPEESYDVSRFCADAFEIENQIHASGRIPLFVGGTIQYLFSYIYGISPMPESEVKTRTSLESEARDRGLDFLYERLESVDKLSAERIHRNDKQRIIRALEVYMLSGKPMSMLRENKAGHLTDDTLIFALVHEREKLYGLINRRFEQMIADGLVEEVKMLCSRGNAESMPGLGTIGYSQIVEYLNGSSTLDEGVARAKQMTRRYAKKQMTRIKQFKTCITVDYTDRYDIVAHIKRTLEAGGEY